jgi:hypothetical protein
MLDQKSKIRKARIVGSSLVITIPPGWAEDGDLFSFKQGFDGMIIKIEGHGQPKEIHQQKSGIFGFLRKYK